MIPSVSGSLLAAALTLSKVNELHFPRLDRNNVCKQLASTLMPEFSFVSKTEEVANYSEEM